MNIEQINAIVAELQDAFNHIQQPRSDYQIKHFVVGQHATEPAQYAQCVLEMQIKYNNIRRGLLAKRKLAIEIDRLKVTGDPIDALTAEEKGIDVEETDLAISGAKREFECLYRLWKSFPRQYTYRELQEAQDGYWQERLKRQARQELLATGRVGVGNQEALRQAGQEFTGEDHEIHSLLAGDNQGRGRAALLSD